MDSLLSGGRDVEIILINDGSTDRTAEIADEYQLKYPDIVRAVHKENGLISIQLHHAGRETSASITGGMIQAPSDCPVAYSDEPVHVLTREEIEDIIAAFGKAAARAAEAGFDAVEIHGAHGYLLTQFLSPYTNTRTDD